MGLFQHFVAFFGILIPLRQRGDIHRRELPDLQRIMASVVKALQLHFLADIEPELEEMHAIFHQQLFKPRRRPHEAVILRRRAEPHDRLDHGAVIPGTVIKNDLALGREMRCIALVIPLPRLGLRRFGQSDDPRRTWIEISADRKDRAALAGRVPAFEQRHHPLARRLHPELHLDQFDLQLLKLLFVFVPVKLVVIGIIARRKRLVVDPVRQGRVVYVKSPFLSTDCQIDRPAFTR
ncbi:hypothetical protein D3C87_1431800 [compost metagenome]